MGKLADRCTFHAGGVVRPHFFPLIAVIRLNLCLSRIKFNKIISICASIEGIRVIYSTNNGSNCTLHQTENICVSFYEQDASLLIKKIRIYFIQLLPGMLSNKLQKHS